MENNGIASIGYNREKQKDRKMTKAFIEPLNPKIFTDKAFQNKAKADEKAIKARYKKAKENRVFLNAK